ncbi:MAG: galactose oxidase [Verrucomicrobia bacterium]|nr:galactose oxidase [Verrucomicrobiota bacterium]NBU10981.1 galactose oxidase [Pseudomonadota bacterium]NDA67155.1 galactose oxidase [Verrucomicrobiota bacterium]NDB75881.1 galactose oxidase [Verrucomicrobiota bacterium]NDD38124.1 galactose oxidase [Verrucomicrobiota bacterium]
MVNRLQLLSLMTAATAASSALAADSSDWTKLPSLPDKEGFASMFAGVSGGALLAAGGANFPDKKPWEGGKKVWYDTVFVLEKPDGAWKVAGTLPRPLAYGVSVTHVGRVLCVGGSDESGHRAECFRMAWGDGKLTIASIPALPQPIANLSGAVLGDTLYVAGGTEKPDSTSALKTFYALDFAAKNATWRELEPWPGPARMLAVAAAQDGSFFLASGADLKPGPDGKPVRTYLNDAYRYTPGKGWQRIADLPRAAVAAPSPAPTVRQNRFLVVSGDDAAQLTVAPPDHKGFPKSVLAYDIRADRWTETAPTPAPRVTVPAVQWNGAWLVVSGEQKPGIRSPEIWRLQP